MSHLSFFLDKYEQLVIEEENISLRKKALEESILLIINKRGVNLSVSSSDEYQRLKVLKIIDEK